MFDSETVRLIQDAEPLEGLDIEKLPQLLTEAYAKVVAARLGAVELTDERRDAKWAESLETLRRLADTYEGFSIFLPEENPHRESCAFVAGAAHHTLSQARLIEARVAGLDTKTPSLSANGIGSEVAACLLFLLAGQQADAAEIAKLFNHPKNGRYESQVLNYLSALASGDGGQLQWIINENSIGVHDDIVPDYLQGAAEALWAKIAHSLRLMSYIVMGIENRESPFDVLDSVLKTISAAQRKVPIEDISLVVRPSLAGPYHFAKLVREVFNNLLNTAVIRVPPPTGVESGEWNRFLRSFALRRPFIWRNHANAFFNGFLEPGCSFVLTFPTGAGKTTVTELRIAAELMRGRKVVYLAPTRALVNQVSQELSERLKPIAKSVVRGGFGEDFGEITTGRVFVQTPEQCLAYLSFDENVHSDLGLVVVDEAHQISGELPANDGSERLPGRRSMDAMWTLLLLQQRSSEADIILISAMVSNGSKLADWLGDTTQRPASVLEAPWKPTRQVRGVVAYEANDIQRLNNILNVRKQTTGKKTPGKADKSGVEAQPLGLFCHTQVWDTASSFAKFPLLPETVPLAVNRHWGVTANRNQVAGRLLAAMVNAAMRPIVFTQQIGYTKNIAKVACSIHQSAGIPEIVVTSKEKSLFNAAALELGGAQFVEGLVEGRIGVHHGLLLWPERMAVESAFRRSDGLVALVATPTVAQGINLPAEAVVIAGDDRWTDDIERGGMQPMAVHELLNAAGRAGRAGHYAHGIVINLPGKVLTIEDKNAGYEINHFNHVMSLFGLPDQCLDVIDPITQVIDRIESAGLDSDVSNYLVRRAAGIPEDQLVRIFNAALGNVTTSDREARAIHQARLLRKFGAVLDDEQEDKKEQNYEQWREFASEVGISPVILADIAAAIPSQESVATWSFKSLLDFVLRRVVHHLFAMVNPDSSGLERIIPQAHTGHGWRKKFTESYSEWESRWRAIIPSVLTAWMAGNPIADIGNSLHTARGANKKVNAVHLGRRFALHSASSVAYGASVVIRIFEKVLGDGIPFVLRSQLQLVSGCVREGFDDPDKLLLFWSLRRYNGLYPRVLVHREFASIQSKLPNWIDMPEVEERRSHIQKVWSAK
ncbi:DEAD/DEAH box helicase [Bradymonas sediminis]|uniref:Uncharacterized protein n=1 Tax=Bradymonas sediminis TaxID=1548548 RepID=A0A2Z4FIK1_9DELT|nr:DEAD/DEAH box helicase [Bradymonas sediminis]AWV88700.1 hypothetical protein DN745_04850 [Bradymonas sediminis]TDP63611.1 RAD3-like DEAD/DEAH box helicase [Bradymonas sediminis]